MCMMAAMGLLLAEHVIKTKYGISTGTYSSSTEEHPTCKPGQGSRMAPALWLIIYCLLLDAMSKLCRGAELCNPTRQTALHQQIGDGFIDYVTNIFNLRLAAMLLCNFGPVKLAKCLQDEA